MTEKKKATATNEEVKKKAPVKKKEEPKKEEIKKSGDISQLLDQMVDEGSKLQKDPKAKGKKVDIKPASKSVAKEDPTEPKKDEKFTKEWTIYYAGMEDKMPKSTPTDGLLLESLRQYLQTMYPEMSAERTTFTLNRDKKQIFPLISGGKKG